MIILDTDHINILQTGKGAAYNALVARMQSSVDQDFCTTVITLEEQMRGWTANTCDFEQVPGLAMADWLHQ